MVFSSLTFLWIFLPLALALNYSLSFIKDQRKRMMSKNIVLLAMSLIFYAGGGISYVLIMVFSILANYLFALIISALKKQKAKKLVLIISVISNIALLIYFKYTNFLVELAETVSRLEFGIEKIILPVGISFFTFQSMSYVIDVYSGRVECQRSLVNVALYVSLFPQLIAGPIVKYKDVSEQIISRTENAEKFVCGIRRFLYGLGKKVIVANTVGEVADALFNNTAGESGTVAVWIALICYTMQIYYDFSGYSDMAIGLGKMFGFDFVENFNYPYIATSVREFWRRWHISLSSWFREYVYIPLGGNRRGGGRTYLNLFIVFFLTGFWHGANYTFIVWGIAHGTLMIIERLFLGKLLEKNKFKLLNHAYTMLSVMLLWVFFRAPSIEEALSHIAKLFIYSETEYSIFSQVSLTQWLVLALAILFSGPLQSLSRELIQRIKTKGAFFAVDYAAQIAIYFACINSLINNSFNPFIYFQF